MRTTWAAAVLLLVSLAACGDSDSSVVVDGSPSPTTATTAPSESSPPTSDMTSPSQDEGCPYLNADQVTATLGFPEVETAGSVHACFFDPQGGEGPSVMLSRVDVQIDPADYAAQTKALCQGEVTDLELGDDAFACVMGLGPQGQLYVGPVLVTVNVNGAADDATGLTMAAALLRDVTIPPES